MRKARLGKKSDSSINIRFLSTYFRDEVDILAAKVLQPLPEKGNKIR